MLDRLQKVVHVLYIALRNALGAIKVIRLSSFIEAPKNPSEIAPLVGFFLLAYIVHAQIRNGRYGATPKQEV